MTHRLTIAGLRWLSVIVAIAFVSACRATPDRSRPIQDSTATSSEAIVPPKSIETMTRAERQAFVAVLRDSGIYRCCTDPACTTCLYENDPRCRCADAIRANDPVCGECYRGWQRGQGSVQGVDVAAVRRR